MNTTHTGSSTATLTLPAGCPGRDEDPHGDPAMYGACHWVEGIPITDENGDLLWFEEAHGLCCTRCYATGGSITRGDR